MARLETEPRPDSGHCAPPAVAPPLPPCVTCSAMAAPAPALGQVEGGRRRGCERSQGRGSRAIRGRRRPCAHAGRPLHREIHARPGPAPPLGTLSDKHRTQRPARENPGRRLSLSLLSLLLLIISLYLKCHWLTPLKRESKGKGKMPWEVIGARTAGGRPTRVL